MLRDSALYSSAVNVDIGILSCCHWQIEIQRMLAHTGLHDTNNQKIVSLLSLMMQAQWDGLHSCTDDGDCACSLCEFALLWYQLSTNILQFIVPASEAPVPIRDVPDVMQLEARAESAKTATGSSSSSAV